MESPGVMSDVPPQKNGYRKGQQEIIRAALERRGGILTAQLPTGYGKTLAAAATFAALEEAGVVNRLLYIVSTDPQRQQFCNDGCSDFIRAGLLGVAPFDLSYNHVLAMKEHRQNKTRVFCTSVQALIQGNTIQVIHDLMGTGRWMVVVDEYHHYGLTKKWGQAVLGLNHQFLLAMSATPERKDQDSAFGAPMIRLTYAEALEEQTVKRLSLHAYDYRIDAVTVNGEVVSYTTKDLMAAVGSDEPEDIDKFILNSKMRWSPKYVSPLVSIPVERLLTNRVKTGLPLQMIVSGMSCLHAAMVYEQVKSMFGDLLRVDWVGTGPNGRPPDKNKAIIEKFCPAKNVQGERNPQDIQLDILIHVGMAGEGLDSVFVSEVVHLHRATICNKEDQENGRASRRIPGLGAAGQHATINVDSASEYAAWAGDRVMQVFDREGGEVPDEEDEDDGEGKDPEDYGELPDEPYIVIADCELLNIDKGDPEVQQWAKIVSEISGLDVVAAMADPLHPLWDRAIEARRRELLDRAQGMNRMSVLLQLKQQVETATGKVALLVIRKTVQGRFEKSLIGDMKKRINGRKKRLFGDVGSADEEKLRCHYQFVKDLEQAVIQGEVPEWLR